MREGSITEQGSHEELMSLNGDYAAMFNNLQLGEAPLIEVRGGAVTQELWWFIITVHFAVLHTP